MNQVTLNNKDYKKVAGLESLNMFKGQLYETIVTTQNGESGRVGVFEYVQRAAL